MPEGLPANPEAETPLQSADAFPQPGTPVALYEGPIRLPDGERPGRIDLDCGPKPGLRWSAELEPGDFRLELGEISLVVHRGAQDWAIDAHERSGGEGWINRAAFARPNARLQRVMVQWMNLPNISGQIALTESTGDAQHWWRGRWRASIDGWKITLDARHDHGQAFTTAHQTRLYGITHAMEIRRTDDSEFGIEEVARLLACIRVTFSFAFGRWVAPVLQVGYDSAANVVWETWISPICDPAKPVGSPWLYRGRPEDLTKLLECAIPAFGDTIRPGNTRFQMSLAIQTVEAGFVEQRILAAAPALEHIAWSELVLTRKWTRKDYEDRHTEDRLRYLLQRAGIPTDIDPAALPALAKFAQAGRLDGPTAVTRVRNRLVHPQTPQDQIYKHDGLVHDVWLLSRRYVTLLLLHSLGYRGHYIDPVHSTGWEGATQPVPWDATTPISPPAMPPAKAGRTAGAAPNPWRRKRISDAR